jgi:small-conductance mechanosensitive channel
MDLKNTLNSVYGYLDIPLFPIAGTPVTVGALIMLALIVLATLVLSRVIQTLVARGLQAGSVSSPGTLGAARRLTHYAVLVVGFSVGLQHLGINLSALFAAGALFAVAIGFAMQNIMQNFVSGVILLVERTIKPDDVLFVDGRVVRVVQMGMRATIVRTRDEEDVILPNSLLVQSSVTNHTLRDSLFRLRVAVGVTYGSDMAAVKRTLEEVAGRMPWRVQKKKPVVYLRAFGGSSVDFEVTLWLEDPWLAPRRMSDLHLAIWDALKDAGIVIAFPQLDVHFDPPVVQSLQGLGRTA